MADSRSICENSEHLPINQNVQVIPAGSEIYSGA
jgi:hypothetical protein